MRFQTTTMPLNRFLLTPETLEGEDERKFIFVNVTHLFKAKFF